jgi:hypothetical protein
MAAAVSRFDRLLLCSGDLAQAGQGARCARRNAMDAPWMWTLACGRTPRSHGYATTREAAIAAFAKSWRRK